MHNNINIYIVLTIITDGMCFDLKNWWENEMNL